jgi:hypothetical protein
MESIMEFNGAKKGQRRVKSGIIDREKQSFIIQMSLEALVIKA